MGNQKISGCGMHHVALGVSDLERSLAFYRELGFVKTRSWTAGDGRTIAMLDIGDGTCFEVFSDCEGEAPADKTRGAYFHLALRVDDSEAAFQLALKAGATVKKEPSLMVLPAEPPIPAVISFVYGPDGEQIEFFEPRES